MMIPWRRLATYAARKLAANPDARAKAVDIAQQVGQEAKRIADDPNRARAAGRATRRLAKKLRQQFQSDDDHG